MYAIIETGGKQLKVAEGQTVSVERLKAEKGSEVTIDKILAVVKDGGDAVYGKPYVSGAKVTAEVLSEYKDEKVLVFKQLPRKNSRKLRGHRQIYTKIKIKTIAGG